jgi:hypothetical protein
VPTATDVSTSLRSDHRSVGAVDVDVAVAVSYSLLFTLDSHDMLARVKGLPSLPSKYN